MFCDFVPGSWVLIVRAADVQDDVAKAAIANFGA